MALTQPMPNMTTDSKLSPTQLQNLTWMAPDPDGYMEYVRTQLQYWTKRKELLREVNAQAKAKLDTDKMTTVGHIDLFLLEEMLVKANHIDESYVADMVQGFPVTGAIILGRLWSPHPRGTKGPWCPWFRRTRADRGAPGYLQGDQQCYDTSSAGTTGEGQSGY